MCAIPAQPVTESEPPGRERRREWTLPAEAPSVGVIRAGVRDFARAVGVSEDTLGAIALAVSEAVTNSVVHAFVGRRPGTISAVVEAAQDEVVIRVADDGRGMQPRPDSPGLGMGLPLIGQMTESLDIHERPGGSGTEICMTFAAPGVRGPSRAAAEPIRLGVLEAVTRISQRGGWPNEGLEAVADLVVPAVADGCAVDLVDDDDPPRRVAARATDRDGRDVSSLLGGYVAEVDRPGTAPARALATCETQVEAFDLEALADPATRRDGSPEARAYMVGVRWRIVVPLVEGGRAFGILSLALRDERGEPDAEMLRFAEAIAERISDALANSRLLEELRVQRHRFERILAVLGEAVTVNDEHGVAVYANEAAARLVGAASVEEVLNAAPGELTERFIITDEDGAPVSEDAFPGSRILRGLDAPPLLTRSVHRATGLARWLLTKATLLDGEPPFAVNIIEDVTEAKEAERRQRFLADAGERLSSTLDYARTLEEVARLAVPALADWCGVDVLGADGRLQRLGLAHVDPDKVALARELDRRYPNDVSDTTQGAGSVLAGGPPVLVPDVTDEMLVQGARDDEHLELLREIGMRSALIVPLRVPARTIGLLSLVNAESGRTFTADDLRFAEEVARRAAIAVENARLYTELASRRQA